LGLAGFGVFAAELLQDWDIGIWVLSAREEVLVRETAFSAFPPLR